MTGEAQQLDWDAAVEALAELLARLETRDAR